MAKQNDGGERPELDLLVIVSFIEGYSVPPELEAQLVEESIQDAVVEGLIDEGVLSVESHLLAEALVRRMMGERNAG